MTRAMKNANSQLPTLSILGGVVLVAAACCLSSGCAWNANASPRSTRLSADPSSVGVSWQRNRPVVEVYLGSRGPYRFLLDTGAGSSAVSRRCARECELDLVKRNLRIDAAGGTGDAGLETTVIRELSLGEARFQGVVAFVVDMESDLDGVLGFPVFADLLLTLDGPRQKISLERGRLPEPESDPSCLALEPGDSEHEVPRVFGSLAGHRILVLIDSGFTGHLYLARGIPADHNLAFVPDPVQNTQVKTRLTTREVVVGQLDEKLELGSLEIEGARTMVGMGPPMILGGAILRELVTTFDQKTRRIRFSKGPR